MLTLKPRKRTWGGKDGKEHERTRRHCIQVQQMGNHGPRRKGEDDAQVTPEEIMAECFQIDKRLQAAHSRSRTPERSLPNKPGKHEVKEKTCKVASGKDTIRLHGGRIELRGDILKETMEARHSVQGSLHQANRAFRNEHEDDAGAPAVVRASQPSAHTHRGAKGS